MRGNTESEDSASDDDRFSDQWEGIVSSLPELADLDVDATAAEIERPVSSTRNRKPRKSRRGKSEPDSSIDDGPELSVPEQIRAAYAPPPSPRDWLEVEDEDDEHFTPPPAPPIKPRGFLTTLFWALLCMSPALLVAFLIFWPGAPRVITVTLVVLFFASAAALILRRPKHRSIDDDNGVAL